MKRKLKLHRETLRNLEDQDVQGAVGGNISTVITQCGSCSPTCAASCAATCTLRYSICVRCI